MLGLRLALGGRRDAAAAAWTPSLLPGVYAYYNVKEAGSIWQDSARTTPATATSDPVGAIDDLFSTHHLLQSTSTARGTLQANGSVFLDGVDDLLVEASAGADTVPPIYIAAAVTNGAGSNKSFVVFHGGPSTDYFKGEIVGHVSAGRIRPSSREQALAGQITPETPNGSFNHGATGVLEFILTAGNQYAAIDGSEVSAANSWSAGSTINDPKVGVANGLTAFAQTHYFWAMVIAKANPSSGDRALVRQWLADIAGHTLP